MKSIYRDVSTGLFVIERTSKNVPDFIKKERDEEDLEVEKAHGMFDWVLIGTKDDYYGHGQKAIDVQPLFQRHPDGYYRFMPYLDLVPYHTGDDTVADAKIKEIADKWGIEL